MSVFSTAFKNTFGANKSEYKMRVFSEARQEEGAVSALKLHPRRREEPSRLCSEKPPGEAACRASVLAPS